MSEPELYDELDEKIETAEHEELSVADPHIATLVLANSLDVLSWKDVRVPVPTCEPSSALPLSVALARPSLGLDYRFCL